MEAPCELCYVTAPDRPAAEKISAALLGRRLAACVSLIPGVSSSYRWEGKIETSEELLLLVKTRAGLREDIIAAVKENHPYSVPEIIFTGIAGGSPDYLRWVAENVSSGEKKGL